MSQQSETKTNTCRTAVCNRNYPLKISKREKIKQTVTAQKQSFIYDNVFGVAHYRKLLEKKSAMQRNSYKPHPV